jgi:hypothetical protein
VGLDEFGQPMQQLAPLQRCHVAPRRIGKCRAGGCYRGIDIG